MKTISQCGEIGRTIDQRNPGNRLGLGAGAVVAADARAGLRQPRGHDATHASEADPAKVMIHFAGSTQGAAGSTPTGGSWAPADVS